MTEPKCPFGEHKMVVSLLQQLWDRLKEEKETTRDEGEKQWKEIGRMISSKSVWAGISIFVVMSIAVVGFLWHNQTANRNEIMKEVKAISAVILGTETKEGLSDRFTRVETKLDDHLKESHNNGAKKDKGK